jgi:hypothetical protein
VEEIVAALPGHWDIFFQRDYHLQKKRRINNRLPERTMYSRQRKAETKKITYGEIK